MQLQKFTKFFLLMLLVSNFNQQLFAMDLQLQRSLVTLKGSLENLLNMLSGPTGGMGKAELTEKQKQKLTNEIKSDLHSTFVLEQGIISKPWERMAQGNGDLEEDLKNLYDSFHVSERAAQSQLDVISKKWGLEPIKISEVQKEAAKKRKATTGAGAAGKLRLTEEHKNKLENRIRSDLDLIIKEDIKSLDSKSLARGNKELEKDLENLNEALGGSNPETVQSQLNILSSKWGLAKINFSDLIERAKKEYEARKASEEALAEEELLQEQIKRMQREQDEMKRKIGQSGEGKRSPKLNIPAENIRNLDSDDLKIKMGFIEDNWEICFRALQSVSEGLNRFEMAINLNLEVKKAYKGLKKEVNRLLEQFKSLSEVVNDLTQYGIDKRVQISKEDREIVYGYLTSMSKKLTSFYEFVNEYDDKNEGKMHEISWKGIYDPRMGRQKRSALNWYRTFIFDPISGQTLPYRVREGSTWKTNPCGKTQFNCWILQKAIDAYI